VVRNWAAQNLDFIYLDGIIGECGCQLAVASLVSDSLRRLGNGMHLFTSWGPPSAAAGCPFETLSEVASYVRVGADTIDSWAGSIAAGFSAYTRLVALAVRAHHFGDLAAIPLGKVHCPGPPWYNQGPQCPPGPDYFIPSNRSHMTKDEVLSYTSLVAMFRYLHKDPCCAFLKQIPAVCP